MTCDRCLQQGINPTLVRIVEYKFNAAKQLATSRVWEENWCDDCRSKNLGKASTAVVNAADTATWLLKILKEPKR